MNCKVLLSFLLLAFLVSCGSDDDICLSGEATPRLKMKFKTQATGKLKTLDSVFVKVDYGNGPIAVIANKVPTDSLLIPLRVDDAPATRIFVGQSRATVTSEVKINYTTSSEYVSPACGIRKIYKNVLAEVPAPAEVRAVEQLQNEITDENKTHFYLLF